jgi:hypothetical protein
MDDEFQYKFELLKEEMDNLQSGIRTDISRYNEIERYLQSSEFAQAVAARSFEGFRVPNIGAGFDVKGKKKYVAILQTGIMLHNALLYVAMLVLVVGVAIVLI